jgi:hypothetical protein
VADLCRNDPTIIEEDRLRRRIAELEQVVRELRQRQPIRSSISNPSTAPPAQDLEAANKKRRVIVDRFARFKIDEAAMAAVAAAAGREAHPASSSPEDGSGGSERERRKGGYGAEPYNTHQLPGEEMVSDTIGRKTFLGAPAGKSMLRAVSHLFYPLVQGLTWTATRTHNDEKRNIVCGRGGLAECT